MSVGIHRHHDGRMTESVLHYLRRQALAATVERIDAPRRIEMPQRVQASVFQLSVGIDEVFQLAIGIGEGGRAHDGCMLSASVLLKDRLLFRSCIISIRKSQDRPRFSEWSERVRTYMEETCHEYKL